MTDRLIRPVRLSMAGATMLAPTTTSPPPAQAEPEPPTPHADSPAPSNPPRAPQTPGRDADECWPSVEQRSPRPPLAELLAEPVTQQWVYVISRVDSSGRIADRSVVRTAGWAAGDRVTVAGWRNEAVILRRDPEGMFVISTRAHLLIPSGLRRRCAVGGGDRVLVAANAGLDTVIVYTMAALQRLLLPATDVLVAGRPS
jgi:hypothetical protein